MDQALDRRDSTSASQLFLGKASSMDQAVARRDNTSASQLSMSVWGKLSAMDYTVSRRDNTSANQPVRQIYFITYILWLYVLET